ncbi:MAG TPA: hypothetical protein DEV73_03340 [Candidatus Zambryskibacteria bacterium]|nr:MAG: hypothetical protein A2694_02975 [Candidatus Blackburnbacteria bacterium RIFCSPHIGHO2_01_FULL_40_17]OGY09904.1 MAG: hypothetical protein A3D24_04355 [Candidatus Blackburnbacteria bacterium RIFCSPHIGHO2_02_FULL_39_13]OGY15802.1 MAG: hypothetical protein A3I52_03235 [Candidatus Blackburnbacteria bacterium RIFCSPLOWO2_02_FULL_40_10]HBL51979.1 hypothetical protein [Candidatus Blackburnbacteria bacterium]HCH59618.1 hypothetical protein [Candidatus Zambryskibacteria bacterium]
MSKIVFDTLIVAIDLLTKSQKPKDERGTGKILSTALALGKNAYPHSHVIDREEARKIGLNVTKDPAMILLLKSYKKWVSFRLAEEVNFHIIEQFSPNKTDDKNEKTEDKIKE